MSKAQHFSKSSDIQAEVPTTDTHALSKANIQQDRSVRQEQLHPADDCTGADEVDKYSGLASEHEAALTSVLLPVSKNQQKKKRRLEKLMDIKKRRKLQDKQVRLERAKVQGRDIQAEQRQQEAARLANDEIRRKRHQGWERMNLPRMQRTFQVCLDCAFESEMTHKEINSLALQIRYCYSLNKHNPFPCQLSATGISSSGDTHQHLQKVNGFHEWRNWAFTVTSDPLDVHYQKVMSNVVYLTSDSTTVLDSLDNSKIYVIGGIVDRNRLKRAAIDRAVALGVETARLPIEEHLQAMASTRVLTCNHVFELLLQYRENGGNWEKALVHVLPSRKEAKFLEDKVTKCGEDANETDEQK